MKAQDGLHWDDLLVCGELLQAGCVRHGERVRWVMHESMQVFALHHLFFCTLSEGDEQKKVWLANGDVQWRAGEPAFFQRMGCMLRQRGLLANLSLRENLLLPFLYSDDAQLRQRAESELEAVGAFLGLSEKLDEKAGERPAYIHALVSLGHCLLKKPDVLLVQELHLGLQADHVALLQDKVVQMVRQLNPALLYLTSSLEDDLGLNFDRSDRLAMGDGQAVEWQW